ncbi:serine hydrolase [Ornithinibacillus sp. L9]|uniref:Serine hydrolase n=1 Tax=Ornithinibacillus caprae TaxID=2678566 RepID=A0A6N8FDU2_9BACI|nr:serine hydrolase [Ornithinibacillus caprae]MUK87832.1 serine hydrolase [Ornithinibacillus caprae]
MEHNSYENLEKNLKSCRIEGFIINKDEKRVFEYFKNKKVQEKHSKVYSITKSITSILIGILIDRGLIQTIHYPIYNYFPDIINNNESSKRNITIFHLLTMTSGLKVANYQASKNWVNSILEQPAIYNPGTTFQYNSGNSHLLSAIITKVTDVSTADFANESLFKPLGINKYSWRSDPQGIYEGGFSLSMNIDDMMKIGLLFLNNGRYNAKQIISPIWVSQSTSAYKNVGFSEYGTYGYGFQLWTFESNKTKDSIDYYYANGIFGQYIFVVPKLNIVAVAKSQLQDNRKHLPKLYFEEYLRSLV